MCLIGRPGSRKDLATPALLLDLDALESNIAAMARFCNESGLALRPHAKTHKSVNVAKMQLAAGARGICVATLREAQVMATHGIAGIHLTTPVVGTVKTEAFVALARAGLTGVVDNPACVDALEDCARRENMVLRLLVDADLGSMLRTGTASSNAALALAERIASSDVLEFEGVQFYSGIVQHIPTMAERKRAYGRELERLAALLRQLEMAGLKPRTISGGGTGTFHIDAESGLFTENQAGSYAVMDMEYAAVELQPGGGRAFENALFVQASVISNNARGLVTVDAGTKSFAMDGPVPRIASGAPAASGYQYFGDEFGMVLSGALQQRMASMPPPGGGGGSHEMFHSLFDDFRGNEEPLAVGSKIELVAPHCDPTVNLHNFYHCVRGDTLVDIWPVDARGSL